MTTEELLIHELAQRAGISVRTIRYYIEEGLLPQPSYQGKYSYYTLEFLDRLELIRRLKESYLPLREIREIMNSLTDDQVKLRLKELPPQSLKFHGQLAASQAVTKPGAKALDYIDRLMDDQSRYKAHSPLEQDINLQRKESDQFFAQNNKYQGAVNSEGTWIRISIAPGVELHLRQPMGQELELRVQQLLNFARKLFQVKP